MDVAMAKHRQRPQGGGNEITDLWREYRRAQQQRRETRLSPRTDDIRALTRNGFDVRALTDYHFRIDGALDLFPIHRRFHDLKTQTRGGYQNALDVAIRRLRTRAAHPQQEAGMQNETQGHEEAPETEAPPPPATSAQGDGDSGDSTATDDAPPSTADATRG